MTIKQMWERKQLLKIFADLRVGFPYQHNDTYLTMPKRTLISNILKRHGG